VQRTNVWLVQQHRPSKSTNSDVERGNQIHILEVMLLQLQVRTEAAKGIERPKNDGPSAQDGLLGGIGAWSSVQD